MIVTRQAGSWAKIWLVSVLCFMPTVSPHAETAASSDPGPLVAAATDNIMRLIEGAAEYFDDDPQRFYDAVALELDGLVDFRSFARGIMGDAASGATYRQLDAEGKAKLREQLSRFTESVRTSLIQTYGKGLLAFGGSRTEVLEAKISPNNERIASVTQKVFGDGDTVYTLRYQMGLYRDGTWRLRNMIIESVNLGEIYRSQFADALSAAEGDVDLVIDQWTIVNPSDG